MKAVRITIRGADAFGVDAPKVEDLLNQLQDFVDLLQGVDKAVSDVNEAEIDWRITNATRNSPLTFEVTPFARRYATNIDARASQVIAATAAGVHELARGSDRPLYFSDTLISKVEKFFERVTDGLSETLVDTTDFANAQKIFVDRLFAQKAISHIQGSRAPSKISYRELGSVEGYIARVELDGYRRPVVWLRTRIDNQQVKCVSKGRGLDRIGHYEVAEVLRGLRVQVFGLITYKDLEKISVIDVDDVHVFESDNELPDIHEIVSPNFTGGFEASEFLRRLREND